MKKQLKWFAVAGVLALVAAACGSEAEMAGRRWQRRWQ